MKTLFPLLSVLLISACGLQTDLRQQTAHHIARPAFMSERFIPADSFSLKSWERMHQNGPEAVIYIEGDSAIIGTTTPFNPVALHLASRDLSDNIAYLARPCQFIKFPQSKGCDDQYWKNSLYTEEIISAYETALNNIVETYDLTGLHLVGYDGGANIAAILAARNKNILTLRTVAGNLNPSLHKKPDMTGQLSAIDVGTKLSLVPQVHFIGGLDQYITPATYHSYRQAVGLSECIQYAFIPDADHMTGWVEQWPELLAMTPQCAETYKYVPPAPPPPREIPDVTFHKGMGK